MNTTQGNERSPPCSLFVSLFFSGLVILSVLVAPQPPGGQVRHKEHKKEAGGEQSVLELNTQASFRKLTIS